MNLEKLRNWERYQVQSSIALSETSLLPSTRVPKSFNAHTVVKSQVVRIRF